MGNNTGGPIKDLYNSGGFGGPQTNLGRKNTILGPLDHYMDNTTGRTFYVKRIIGEGDHNLKKMTKKIPFLRQQKKNVVNIMQFGQDTGGGEKWCAAPVFNCKIEGFDFSLNERANDLAANHSKFSEGELWSIIIDCVKGLHEYEKFNEWNGAISQGTVVMLNGEYHILDSCFVHMDHFDTARLRMGEHFSAPEVFNQITTGYTDPVLQSKVKADLYSLGLTILSVTVKGFSPKYIYDRENLFINEDYILKSITSDDLTSNYSPLFLTTLGDLLAIDEYLRPTPSILLKFYLKYERQLKSGRIDGNMMKEYEKFSDDMEVMAFQGGSGNTNVGYHGNSQFHPFMH